MLELPIEIAPEHCQLCIYRKPYVLELPIEIAPKTPLYILLMQWVPTVHNWMPESWKYMSTVICSCHLRTHPRREWMGKPFTSYFIQNNLLLMWTHQSDTIYYSITWHIIRTIIVPYARIHVLFIKMWRFSCAWYVLCHLHKSTMIFDYISISGLTSMGFRIVSAWWQVWVFVGWLHPVHLGNWVELTFKC